MSDDLRFWVFFFLEYDSKFLLSALYQGWILVQINNHDYSFYLSAVVL